MQEVPAKLLRIFIGESDHHRGRPLYKYLVEFLKDKGIAGTTVIRGIAGYGATNVIHTTSIVRLSTDLPIIVEVVDEAEKIDQVKPELLDLLQGGLLTEETCRIIQYEPNDGE